MITETESDFSTVGDAEGVCCPIVGHVADGNFHCLIPYNPNDAVQSKVSPIACLLMIHITISLS